MLYINNMDMLGGYVPLNDCCVVAMKMVLLLSTVICFSISVRLSFINGISEGFLKNLSLPLCKSRAWCVTMLEM